MCRALAALGPNFGFFQSNAKLLGPLAHEVTLRVGIAAKEVEGNNWSKSKAAEVFDMALEVDHALLQRVKVLCGEFLARLATVVLLRTNRGYDHGAGYIKITKAGFDIHELFAAEVSTKASFSEDDVTKAHRSLGREQSIATMGDVGEGATMNKSRGSGQGLYQVRVKRVPHKRSQGTLGIQVASGYWLGVVGVAHRDVTQALLQIGEVRSETQNCHDFRGCRDGEAGLSWYAVGRSTQPSDDVAQGAVIDIDTTLPCHATRIDVERIALMDVVINDGGQRIGGCGDSVKITGEVEVDVLHRNYLRVATTGSATFDAHDWSLGRLTESDDSFLTECGEGIGEANEDRRFTFTGRSRRHPRYENKLSFSGHVLNVGDIHFGLGATKGNQC